MRAHLDAKKKKQLALAGGGLAVLAVLYLVVHRSSAAAGASTPVTPGGQLLDPSTGMPLNASDPGNATDGTSPPFAGGGNVPYYDPNLGAWIDPATGQPMSDNGSSTSGAPADTPPDTPTDTTPPDSTPGALKDPHPKPGIVKKPKPPKKKPVPGKGPSHEPPIPKPKPGVSTGRTGSAVKSHPGTRPVTRGRKRTGTVKPPLTASDRHGINEAKPSTPPKQEPPQRKRPPSPSPVRKRNVSLGGRI